MKGRYKMTYSDIINKGLILEKKNKYTKKDYDILLNKGYNENISSFIVICSAVYHDTSWSKYFDNSLNFI